MSLRNAQGDNDDMSSEAKQNADLINQHTGIKDEIKDTVDNYTNVGADSFKGPFDKLNKKANSFKDSAINNINDTTGNILNQNTPDNNINNNQTDKNNEKSNDPSKSDDNYNKDNADGANTDDINNVDLATEGKGIKDRILDGTLSPTAISKRIAMEAANDVINNPEEVITKTGACLLCCVGCILLPLVIAVFPFFAIFMWINPSTSNNLASIETTESADADFEELGLKGRNPLFANDDGYDIFEEDVQDDEDYSNERLDFTLDEQYLEMAKLLYDNTNVAMVHNSDAWRSLVLEGDEESEHTPFVKDKKYNNWELKLKKNEEDVGERIDELKKKFEKREKEDPNFKAPPEEFYYQISGYEGQYEDLDAELDVQADDPSGLLGEDGFTFPEPDRQRTQTVRFGDGTYSGRVNDGAVLEDTRTPGAYNPGDLSIGLSFDPKKYRNGNLGNDRMPKPNDTETYFKNYGRFKVKTYNEKSKKVGSGEETAWGPKTKLGFVVCAADEQDRPSIPFGTRMYIPDYGYAIVADTDQDLKNNELMAFLPSGVSINTKGMKNVAILRKFPWEEYVHWGKTSQNNHAQLTQEEIDDFEKRATQKGEGNAHIIPASTHPDERIGKLDPDTFYTMFPQKETLVIPPDKKDKTKPSENVNDMNFNPEEPEFNHLLTIKNIENSTGNAMMERQIAYILSGLSVSRGNSSPIGGFVNELQSILESGDFGQDTSTPTVAPPTSAGGSQNNRSIPKHRDFKSYMDFRTITNKASKQYEMQQKAKSVDGFRMYNGRYMIALGSYWGTVGDNVDVTLENGTVLRCVIGDQKADIHTDAKNQFHLSDGSFMEFIVDTRTLSSKIKTMGDCSYAPDRNFNSPAVAVYNSGGGIAPADEGFEDFDMNKIFELNLRLVSEVSTRMLWTEEHYYEKVEVPIEDDEISENTQNENEQKDEEITEETNEVEDEIDDEEENDEEKDEKDESDEEKDEEPKTKVEYVKKKRYSWKSFNYPMWYVETNINPFNENQLLKSFFFEKDVRKNYETLHIRHKLTEDSNVFVSSNSASIGADEDGGDGLRGIIEGQSPTPLTEEEAEHFAKLVYNKYATEKEKKQYKSYKDLISKDPIQNKNNGYIVTQKQLERMFDDLPAKDKAKYGYVKDLPKDERDQFVGQSVSKKEAKENFVFQNILLADYHDWLLQYLYDCADTDCKNPNVVKIKDKRLFKAEPEWFKKDKLYHYDTTPACTYCGEEFVRRDMKFSHWLGTKMMKVGKSKEEKEEIDRAFALPRQEHAISPDLDYYHSMEMDDDGNFGVPVMRTQTIGTKIQYFAENALETIEVASRLEEFGLTAGSGSMFGEGDATGILKVAFEHLEAFKSNTHQVNRTNAKAGRGRAYFNTEFYGNNQDNEWCAMFVSVCAEQAGLDTTIIPKTAGVIEHMNFAKRENRYHKRGSYVPKPGDLIIYRFRNDSVVNHIGIVYDVAPDGKILTIEGNTSGQALDGSGNLTTQGNSIGTKERDPNYAEIDGYVSVKYPDPPSMGGDMTTGGHKWKASDFIKGKSYIANCTSYYPYGDMMQGGYHDRVGRYLWPPDQTIACPNNSTFKVGKIMLITGTGTDKDGKLYTITDTGGAIVQQSRNTIRVDILSGSREEAYAFGVRNGAKATFMTPKPGVLNKPEYQYLNRHRAGGPGGPKKWPHS